MGVRAVLRRLAVFLFRLAVGLSYGAYKAEGINGLLLVLPAKLIAPVLRKHGAKIGERVVMHSPLIIHNADERVGRHYHKLIVGNDCYLGRDLLLDLKDQIFLESKVTLSMRVALITHTDVGESPLRDEVLRPTQAPIVLRRGAYVGAGAMILQGVEIGESAVVGAGAVVVDSIPAHTVAVGVPAKVVRALAQEMGRAW